ncbi:BREX-2 system adenine-specific DNA-methyltransferase PglX [Streptantibioticus rubrisoli]|uniref:site-specific DNA-methyltransferase (adenine-specific) n=1 Tax=Streptantibioticus rubrisoli TaxID=1387313 RepID=A0ABT1PD11_9ACTN|nr:BREX-2 system adenine-specific DNA-methyltransferase PglX [Streptantibioticus rubrisoli]MCQ4043247.1 BREX-2 system adenine-specific DNA-methyltransferase PglX [Streptantibioticus rubrisoli]
MIDRKALLDDLKQQVKAVETDLDKQVRALTEVRDRLKAEHKRAFDVKRTGATWNSWLDERITQVAVAWVLGTVFVRFCEDNRLIPEPYLTGPDGERHDLALERYAAYASEDPDPTYRGWLERAFAELGEGQAGRLLFNPDRNPLFQIPVSHDGARALVEFWRERDEQGALVHDFTDPLNEDGTEGWNTRFLGDLYQDLSEAARKTYALLQTPEFVEEFILDRTMNPVVRELGGAFGELKMIDPTCGSGHFVLGAFRRMVALWAERRPDVDRHARVRAALDAVHGVDVNPFAVAIARFRLLVAAMAVAGMRTLAEAGRWDWPIHLAVGDSLIKARQLGFEFDDLEAGDPLAEFSYSTEDIHEPEYKGILEQGRYHVVVGNPPYITVKDKALNELYKGLYSSCARQYQLTVPFAERFFQLAKRPGPNGSSSGYVGQITSNGFMKREFGKRLIEDFFANDVELTEVIDTSGAYIPGHGTPTVILIGRRNKSGRSATVRMVMGKRGEPGFPEVPAQGLVWQAIVSQVDNPDTESEWVSSTDTSRDRLRKHPWSLSGGGASELRDRLESSAETTPLYRFVQDSGNMLNTREDDAYLTRGAASRAGISPDLTRRIVEGFEIRDWATQGSTETLFPYSQRGEQRDISTKELKTLWPSRQLLHIRKSLSGTQEERGLPWYEYSSFSPERYNSKKLLVFTLVATHQHFFLRDSDEIFSQAATVFTLEEGSAAPIVGVLGILNSSTACFWLKQVSQPKAGGGNGRGMQDEAWEERYEFTGTKLKEFPLPSRFPVDLAANLHRLAKELAATSPSALTSREAPTPASAALREAQAKWTAIRAQMIALQEELDWQVYFHYDLHAENLRSSEAEVPDLSLGERAFEIALARQVEEGKASTEWFKRHGSTPITSIPEHWPDAYKAVVQKRIDAIENSRAIGMIERPEYKRRWATEGWDKLQERALRGWLLDRIEKRELWYQDGDQPTLLTRSQLTDALSRDEDFVSVAAIYAPNKDLPAVVADLLADEHVPFLAALRYKPSGLKKRADWEHVWDLQRKEDAAPDEPAKRKIRDTIPVPPKYTSADFLKPSYWRARGKLDVPKERFISYSSTTSGVPELYGWAGWDHREQAQALTTYFTNNATTTEELTPLLAGLLELQPWLGQWHDEFDPTYGMSPAAFFAGYRAQIQGEHGLTDDDLRAWRPAAPTRGRRATKK